MRSNQLSYAPEVRKIIAGGVKSTEPRHSATAQSKFQYQPWSMDSFKRAIYVPTQNWLAKQVLPYGHITIGALLVEESNLIGPLIRRFRLALIEL